MRYQDSLSSLRFKRETKFVLIGPEDFLKFHFINVSQEIYSNNEFIIAHDYKEAIGVMGSENIFGTCTLVLKDFSPEIVKYVKSFDGLFILYLSEKADLKSRAMSELLSCLHIVECNKLREYGADYPLWIISYASERGFSFLDNAEDLIYSKVGPDMFRISKELEKLFIVKGSDTVIAREEVEKYISMSAGYTAFDLMDNLLKRDINNALKCYDSYIMTQESVTDVVHFLGKYMEKLYRILLLREQKMEPDDIADIVGIPRFLVKTKYMSRALNLGKSFITSKIDELCTLDAQLRLFKGDKNILLKKFIIGYAN